MSTDSLYIAISAHTLDEVIKPELWEEWQKEKYNWFPRDDTEENKKYDMRKPGKFRPI